jgi:AAA domain/DnaB-like helicase N terminal domain
MREADRPALPYDRDAERCVLESMLSSNAAIAVVIETGLKASDFFTADNSLSENQTVYTEILAMHELGVPVDLVTLNDSLSKRGKLALAGGTAYIAALVSGMGDPRHVKQYAEIVCEKARLRNLIKTADKWQRRALEPTASAQEVFAGFEQFMRDYAAGTPAPSGHPQNGHRKTFYPLIDFLKAQFPVPEHLVEGLIPRGGSVMIVALPHRMKSWFTTGLALGATRPGKALGTLTIKNPVRTMLVQIEDPPGDLQWRIQQLMSTGQFTDCDPDAVAIIERNQFSGFTRDWCVWLKEQIRKHRSDLVVYDVVRRLFVGRGDVNSPKDSADFLEEIDGIRDETGSAAMLVHHENKKDAELMTAAAGSYNFAGWANVVIQIKRKVQEGHITRVEIEADNKLGQSPEPMRMILDLTSPSLPLRMEALEDGEGFRESMDQLGSEWTVRDLSEVLGVHKSNALRRLKKWMADGKVIKISSGKRGRTGGLAKYAECEGGSGDPDVIVPPPRRIQ